MVLITTSLGCSGAFDQNLLSIRTSLPAQNGEGWGMLGVTAFLTGQENKEQPNITSFMKAFTEPSASRRWNSNQWGAPGPEIPAMKAGQACAKNPRLEAQHGGWFFTNGHNFISTPIRNKTGSRSIWVTNLAHGSVQMPFCKSRRGKDCHPETRWSMSQSPLVPRQKAACASTGLGIQIFGQCPRDYGRSEERP